MKSIATLILCLTLVNGQGYMPFNRLRKAPPVLDGGNDIYAPMESAWASARGGAGRVPDGMAVLYASSPIFSPVSKDPEEAREVYAVLPASQAVRRGAALRRLLEDALLEMGFPLEELTHYDASSGRVVKIKKASDADAPDAAEVDAPIVEDKEVSTDMPPMGESDVGAILAALQGPLPYVRRGAWGR